MTRTIKLVAALATSAAGAAFAAGPSGTDSVAELTLSGNQLAMLFGGAVLLGVTIWAVIRVLNRSS